MPQITNGTGIQVIGMINDEFDALRLDATATLPASIGWYRIAQSPAGIFHNSAIVRVNWSENYTEGGVIFAAQCHHTQGEGSVGIQQLSYASWAQSGIPGIERARIVYSLEPWTGGYAYLEVFKVAGVELTLNIRLIDPVGWTVVSPTIGEVPTGYATYEHIFSEEFIFFNMASKNGDAPPSAYPVGYSEFLVTDTLSGWVVPWGMVETLKHMQGTYRARQFFYENSGGMRTWIRLQIPGADAWGPWTVIAPVVDDATHAVNASNADRLENKHWVVAAEGQITISAGGVGVIGLGRSFYQHNFYLISVNTPIQIDDVIIVSYDDGIHSFFWIERNPAQENQLYIKNRHITVRDFCYKVLVWE